MAMKGKAMLIAAGATVVALALSGCGISKPPLAIEKSSYTAVDAAEHQKLPLGTDLLTLQEAQAIAIQNNPSFKSRYFAISQARAQYLAHYANYLPTVTAGYSIGNTHYAAYSNDAGNSFTSLSSSPTLTAQMTVFDSFQREMNLLAARHNWKATEATEQDSRRLLLQSVAQAYNNIMLANAQQEIARENMRYQRRLLKETELKFGVGTSNLSDVLNFKVNYENAEASLYSADYSYAVAKFTLASLMGLTEGNIPDYVRFPEMLSADGEMLTNIEIYLDMALANRPDLKALRESLESAKYSYYSSICAFGPTVTASLSLGYSDDYTRNSPNREIYSRSGKTRSRYGTLSYSGAVSWTLFSGGSRFMNLRASQAVMEQADFELANQWIQVVVDVRTAYENYLVNLKTVKLLQRNLESVRKMRDLVDEEYIAGNCNITRVNEAQNYFVEAEGAKAQAIANLHNAKAQLLAATNAI